MPAEKTVISGVRVFDGHGLSEPRAVLLDGGVLGADDPDDADDAGATRIDADGAVLLPGLIDAHVHLHDADTPRELAAHGVTTGLDMACWPVSLVDSLRDLPGVADIRSSGAPAIGPAGPHSRLPGLPGDAVVRTPEHAHAFVAARVAEGSDYIKLVLEAPGDGGPDEASAAAVIAAAHSAGRIVIAHAATPGAYELALSVGADLITHIPPMGPLPATDIARMTTAGAVAVPTLTMMAAMSELVGIPDGEATAVANTAALHGAGIPILAGTDANALANAPDVPFGASMHRELELLVAAGMRPADALRASTVDTANRFGLTDRGELRPGARADLLLVDGDPLADIRATRNVLRVWCAGIPVE